MRFIALSSYYRGVEETSYKVVCELESEMAFESVHSAQNQLQ